MRNVLRPILFAGAALVPALAIGAPATGFIGLDDCSNTIANVDALNAELYVLKLTNVASNRTNDWQWAIDQKGETGADPQAAIDPGGFWTAGDIWALTQNPPDVAFAFVTFSDGGLYVDNADSTVVDWGVAPVQQVGDTLRTGLDGGVGLAIPGTSAQLNVQLRPGVTKSFPVRAQPSGSTAGSVNVAFGTIAEVNANEGNPATPGACSIGGALTNPLDTTRGAIIGYNVYRIPGTAGTVPTRADFDAALRTDTDADGGWVYFADLRTFNVTLADTTGTGDAPSDTAVTDLVGLQNPDGRMYSGDEILILQDAANRAGVSRTRMAELTPVLGQSYWYAVQPVVVGTLSSFAATGFTINDFFTGDHTMDLDGDGEDDAVSLDTTGPHNTPEFISPQGETENGSQAGLGLTNGGMPLLSAPMFVDGGSALPSFGQVSLSGSVQGNDVNVQFTTGLERGNVLGYNVYRVVGGERVRVNEQPILAQGSESNVYQLVDVATRSRGARSVDYMVEIVYADGSASSMVGPFSVSLDQQPARRRR